jgi:Transposase.
MLLQRLEEHGEAFLCSIVTGGDETWVFYYTPQVKAESMIWKHPHSPVKKKFKTVQSSGKVVDTVFWDIYEFLLIDIIRTGSIIKAAAYKETLNKLKEAVPKKCDQDC